ncbi:HutD/Ves family protein [Rhizobium oryzihabitans]|uniref:HutD/Ves family protein n=1 Tax=Rhizobium oryzihabitans TaxID=2267833 RepID=UPI004035D66B
MKILRASEYKTMPWKNGGGVTVEIAIHPPGASVDAFEWRISMATVAQDGPFSSFPGIDRTLAIIEGNGMALAIAGDEPVALTTKSTPLPFAADVPVDASLMDGSIVDLNIMTRRSSFSHSVERLSGSYSAEAGTGTRMILSLHPLTVSFGNDTARLEKLDSIFIPESLPFTVRPDHDDGVFFLITLRRI